MKSTLYVLVALLAALFTGFYPTAPMVAMADIVCTLFMNFLKFIAAPIVFLSIFSTLLGMEGFKEMKTLGKKVFGYTLLTTLIAASIALLLYQLLNPAQNGVEGASQMTVQVPKSSYLDFFIQIVPSNLFKPFLENNVISIAFLGFLFGMAAQNLPKDNKEILSKFFSSFFKLILKVTEYIISFLPIGIWGFVTNLIVKMDTFPVSKLFLYLAVILGANLLQGIIVLPLFLKAKGLSPIRVFKGSTKAILLAFFSKSSNATLPISLQCAEKMNVDSKIARFSLPLCTVINMNGCAAFILTTVLFVSEVHGVVFSPLTLVLWVFLATIAAIGNAGVPMGCFFLSSAFLIAAGVPISLMGVILPFYAVLDMIETALNVWSDIAVTAVVDHEIKQEALSVNL